MECQQNTTWNAFNDVDEFVMRFFWSQSYDDYTQESLMFMYIHNIIERIYRQIDIPSMNEL